ncbi:NMD protein affecting ribosome stability and mRNA decay [Methanofollis formosanus]|uniref:NMD protein affecting ribosome stability and mRNA decay n=1 Tax=Methanofollis formosanus TaxID=299308 RepID=A0A8G0ZYZ8_9EURY|nr:60S ribosomal export protein NMD3 [Methanofollis formosanus]QYZ78679.1 NMD protein affecting ribosome stability and mRNA decay [Methanofollis formosanus]
MEILRSVCPRCGKPSAGLCNECRAAETEWLKCEPRVESIFCPVCGSQKHGRTWTDTTVDHETLVNEIALAALILHPDLRGAETTLTYTDPTPNRTFVDLTVSGRLYGVEVSGTCKVKIVWIKEQCDRCNRISGGYYEGIIQLRATGRKPSGREMDRAMRIAEETEDGLQEAGERLSFVSSIDETKDGIDIVVGSQHIGQIISSQLCSVLGGKMTTHPKLVGERDGKRLYRVTYLVRLPRFQTGDVVVVRKGYMEVRGAGHGRLQVYDLKEGTARFIAEDEIERLVGNVGDAENALVTYHDGDVIGLLDPGTQAPVECRAVPWLQVEDGGTIRILRDEETERLVLVG